MFSFMKYCQRTQHQDKRIAKTKKNIDSLAHMCFQDELILQ